ncbi:hypothetical protein, partial [Actinomyces sp. MRS3W]|uniref:hypothetical protein n=1 Tax=Actinomyces sp. MRS3W TaxID=2800796 RepID=UPI0028FCFC6F
PQPTAAPQAHPAPAAPPAHPRPAAPVSGPRPSLPPTVPPPGREVQREGNIGRYVLSGAAALLIVSAAVSLIALVWDRIPDIVKVGALGVIAVALVSTGTFLTNTRKRQQVAAATLTGTGGALGFVAIIGAVLTTGLAPAAALGLMVVWAFVLLLVSCVTGQFFTAVISMVGALVTVGFATWQVSAHPEQTVLTWALIDTYVIALAVVASLLPRFSPRMRLRAWLPTTSIVVTASVLLAGPTRLLLTTAPLGIALLTLPCLVLMAQVHHSTRLLVEVGSRQAAAIEWGLTGAVIAAAISVLGYADGVSASLRSGVAITFLVLMGLSTLALLPRQVPSSWLTTIAPVHLGTVIAVAAFIFAADLDLLAATVLIVALASVPVVRLGYSVPVVVLPFTGLGALVAGFVPAATTRALALVAVLIGVALAVGLEWLLAPPRPNSDEAINRPMFLYAAAWLVAGNLVILMPLVLNQMLPTTGAGVIVAPLVSGALALALAGMGLFTSESSPRMLICGERAGRLEGAADLHTPLSAAPPPLAWLGDALLTAQGLALLVRADHLNGPLLATPLVGLALALAVAGGRMLLPWRRRTGVTLTVAISHSLMLWWSVMILTGASATSMLMTAMVLATGAVCIVVGFRARITTLRHYGLTLVLLVVFKLAVVDVARQNSLMRILALVVAGVVCFCLSLAYNRFAQEQERTADAVSWRPPGDRPTRP